MELPGGTERLAVVHVTDPVSVRGCLGPGRPAQAGDEEIPVAARDHDLGGTHLRLPETTSIEGGELRRISEAA
jgi:hypothetical protein